VTAIILVPAHDRSGAACASCRPHLRLSGPHGPADRVGGMRDRPSGSPRVRLAATAATILCTATRVAAPGARA